MSKVRQAIAQTDPANRQPGRIEITLQMVTTQVDRGWQNYRSSPGGLCEAGQKVVSCNDGRAMSHRAQELLEIFSAQRLPMFLFAKHHRVVEIENDAAVCAVEQGELEVVVTQLL